jgi:hypothetical protein
MAHHPHRWDEAGGEYVDVTDRVHLRYDGWPKDLIAAGIVPAPMLIMDTHGPRKRRVDADGDRWYVFSYFRMTERAKSARVSLP